MKTTFNQRNFIADLGKFDQQDLRDCSGEIQAVAASDLLKDLPLKLDDTIEIFGRVRADSRSKYGYEVDVLSFSVLNPSEANLPFNSSSNIESVGIDTLIEYRPLALRNDSTGDVFRLQAALLKHFREFLTNNRFTEIITSKIVIFSKLSTLSERPISPKAPSSTRNTVSPAWKEYSRQDMYIEVNRTLPAAT